MTLNCWMYLQVYKNQANAALSNVYNYMSAVGFVITLCFRRAFPSESEKLTNKNRNGRLLRWRMVGQLNVKKLSRNNREIQGGSIYIMYAIVSVVFALFALSYLYILVCGLLLRG